MKILLVTIKKGIVAFSIWTILLKYIIRYLNSYWKIADFLGCQYHIFWSLYYYQPKMSKIYWEDKTNGFGNVSNGFLMMKQNVLPIFSYIGIKNRKKKGICFAVS